MARRHGAVLPARESAGNASPAGPETAVLVELGAQPSAGYGVLLDREVADISGGTATVAVRVERPAPGSMSAAVVTSPCLLLHVPKGPYTRVRVVDAGGVELGTVAVGP